MAILVSAMKLGFDRLLEVVRFGQGEAGDR
jgi:hypothetical protein